MTRHSTNRLLSDMLERAERIRSIHASMDDEQRPIDAPEVIDATLYNFIVIGEIANRLGEPFYEQHPDIPWAAIIGQRNIIAHGYDILDLHSLTETIEVEIPKLIDALKQLLNKYPPPAEA